MDKIEFISFYIDKCDEIIKSGNVREADELQDEIIGVFEPEIGNIRGQLDNYSGYYSSNHQVDFIGDLKLLKQKLTNYVMNIKEEANKRQYALELARLNQPVVTANAEAVQEQVTTITTNIDISISRIITQLDEIEDNKLSKEDKEVLKEYAYSLEGIRATKDKSKFWDRSKEVLKFIADKGVDVAIAMLPYIISGLS